ncbi:MAG: LPP20 family lipoprotein, partial [Verrucomicrobiota bacterium]|nr:LPP20 family lipoprotein [Verrucomicrobiota bacterium]
MRQEKGRMVLWQNNLRISLPEWKKPFFRQIILPTLLLSLFGCKSLTGGGTPEWVANPKAIYPESEYLVSVGEGDTRRAAENAAAANLSRIFEAHIDSDERLLDQSTETGKSFERTTDFTASINILSSQTLYNIQHAEAWKDTLGRYHAVAYLDRRNTASIYRSKIGEQTTRVNFLLASAQNSDNLLKKYATLRAANRHAAEAGNLLRQLKVIHPPSVPDSTPGYSPNKLGKVLADTAKQIKVQINVDGDDGKRMASTLEEFITRYGFVVGKPVVLNFGGRVAITDTGERNQDLVFVRYELSLQIKDTDGNILVSVGDKGREA